MITLINNAISTGESEPISIVSGSNSGQDIHSFQVNTTGSPTALTVAIFASLDGINYDCVLTHKLSADEIASGGAMFHLVNKPAPSIKASIDVLEGGATPAVSMYYFKGNE